MTSSVMAPTSDAAICFCVSSFYPLLLKRPGALLKTSFVFPMFGSAATGMHNKLKGPKIFDE